MVEHCEDARSQTTSRPMSVWDEAELGALFRALLASTKLSNALIVFMVVDSLADFEGGL